VVQAEVVEQPVIQATMAKLALLVLKALLVHLDVLDRRATLVPMQIPAIPVLAVQPVRKGRKDIPATLVQMVSKVQLVQEV
jgi:hypothetical protein